MSSVGQETPYYLTQTDGSVKLSPRTTSKCEKKNLYSPLVSSCKHLLKPNGSISGLDVARSILPLFPSFCSAIPADLSYTSKKKPAIASIDGRRPISHTRIRDFVLSEFGPALHNLGFGRGDRIAVVLPNGPELALSIVSVINWASCVPLNAVGARSELEMDLKGCNADLIIGPHSGSIPKDSVYGSTVTRNKNDNVFHVDGIDFVDYGAFGYVKEIAMKLGIPFVGLLPSNRETGIFELVPPEVIQHIKTPQQIRKHLQDEADAGGGSINLDKKSNQSSSDDEISRKRANSHENEVLVLFTSGTTGSKKLVPHLLGDMLVAAGTISVSWDLTPSDVNCNLMPLFHVGGIVRQIFSPLLSGGCVICCPSFDPSIFWTLLNKRAFTWYYAAPTMHQIILQTGKEVLLDKNQNSGPKLRMIANAAGGLLPSLAIELRKTFRCNVLPSYGMTECMPISSPPFNYELSRPGTSGVAVGPEIAILNTSTSKCLPDMTEGPICVRGTPCFRGYGRNLSSSEQRPMEANASFLKGGWFNTGDLGYMDKDGYLFITGRSKEVINRGGEIISPLEVEEAIVSHPNVIACAAFSAKHHVLQEVVAVVIVPVKDRPRLDLHSLHEFLGDDRLVAAKWPQCIVFMDALPRNNTNKLLRVKLGERLGLPEINDGLYAIERTFEAKCPRQGTSVSTPIPTERVRINPSEVESILKSIINAEQSKAQIAVRHHPTRIGSLVCYLLGIEKIKVVNAAEKELHKYTIPTHFTLLQNASEFDNLPVPAVTDSISAIKQGQLSPVSVDPLTRDIQDIFVTLIDLDCRPHIDENFFNLGGTSMLASQLAAKLRKTYAVPLSGAEVFHNASCKQMAKVVKDRSNIQNKNNSSLDKNNDNNDLSNSGSDQSMSGISSLCSRKDLNLQSVSFSTKRKPSKKNIFTSIYQLIPLVVLFPMWQMTRFFCFFLLVLNLCPHIPGNNHLLIFFVALFVFHLLWITIMPLVFVLIKWCVVGKYLPGRYPLWGSTYLRWWFVEVCRNVIGRGIFGANENTLNFYYRLLGANIGKNARISIQCDLAEYDLVTVGEGAALDDGTVRAFAIDNGCMKLGPVTVGNFASVGMKSIVAPSTSVPDHAHLGPQASSYEAFKSMNAGNGKYNRYNFPDPHPLWIIAIGHPLCFLVDLFSQVPSLYIFYLMISSEWHHHEKFQTLQDIITWLAEPKRIPYYFGIRIARGIFAPLVYMFIAILVKRCIIGKFKPGPVDLTSNWQLMRHWLVASLFTRENLRDVVEIIGRHFEGVSVLYRLLGAKVGKRVFWPGSQMEFTGEFDLLEIGDDVVFGSRSVILCRSTESIEKVVLCAGCNVADNCVVMPGAVFGKNAVLGSSGIAPPGWYLPESSVWFGSRLCEPVLLEIGVDEDYINDTNPIMASSISQNKLQMEGDETTLRPFGKATYHRDASYFVFPLSLYIVLSVIIISLISILHALPALAAVHAATGILFGWPISEREYDNVTYSNHTFYVLLVLCYIIAHNIRVLAWLGIEVASKWGLLRKRIAGQYNWDTSNYNQNWEIYQIITRVRRLAKYSFFDFLHGTPFFSMYWRLLGCKIGENACLYPTGGDPYMPEPDLVTIGNDVAIDQSALVCHLNTRGNFEITEIEIGDNVTLRSRTRVQKGSKIENGSMLLEHSLAMTGEVIEASSVWQGAPATPIIYYSNNNNVSRGNNEYELNIPNSFGGAMV